MLWLLKYFIIGMNFVVIYILKKARDVSKVKGREEKTKKKCLIAIAHPDDESMFFLPSIENLKDEGYTVHIICFSNGNSKIREDELVKAAKFLHIDKLEILDLTSKGVIDGMENEWNTKVLSDELLEYVRKENIEGLFSFDDRGVSGHLNHIAISKAIKENLKEFYNIKVYFLDSLPLIKKYFPLFEFLHILIKEFVSLISDFFKKDATKEETFRFYNWNLVKVWRAMSIHHSQFVWFRKLFVLFSSYGFVNTFTKVN
jgi:N-acetylglucosaminylphosphatidylinositol deacetylase